MDFIPLELKLLLEEPETIDGERDLAQRAIDEPNEYEALEVVILDLDEAAVTWDLAERTHRRRGGCALAFGRTNPPAARWVCLGFLAERTHRRRGGYDLGSSRTNPPAARWL